MERKIYLFKNIFRTSSLFILLAIVVFQLLLNLVGISSNSFRYVENGAFIYLFKSLYTIISTLLFGLVLPWLSFSFFGEWLFTRSFERNNIFKIFFQDYLKWFAPFSAILILITIYDRIIFHSSFSRMDISLIIISLNFYLSMILSGNSILLKKFLLRGIPVFLFTGFFGNYSFNGISLGYWASWTIWIIYLAYSYKISSDYQGDLDLNVPGRYDDENQSISNMKVFSMDFSLKAVKLRKYSSPLEKAIAYFRLIASESSDTYKKILLVISMICFFFALNYLGSYVLGLWNYNGKENNYFFSVFAIYSLVFGVVTFSFVNARFLNLRRQEFLFTRTKSRVSVYLVNYMLQAAYALFTLALLFIFIRIHYYEAVYKDIFELSWTSVLLFTIWLLISGEVGILTIIALFLYSSISASAYTWTFIWMLGQKGIYGYILWLIAIASRTIDIYLYSRAELFVFKDIISTIKRMFGQYIPVISSFLLITAICIKSFPASDFIINNFNHKYSINNINRSLIESSFYNKSEKSLMLTGLDKIKSGEDTQNGYYFIAMAILNDYLNNLPYSFRVDNAYFYNNVEPFFSDYDNHLEKTNKILSLAGENKENENFLYIQSLIEKINDNYPKAIEFSVSGLEKKPENEVFLKNLAELYTHNFQYEKAIEVYKKLYQKENTFRKIFYADDIFKLYMIQNKYKEAIDFNNFIISENGIASKYSRPFKIPFYKSGKCDLLENELNNNSVKNKYYKFEQALCNDSIEQAKDFISENNLRFEDELADSMEKWYILHAQPEKALSLDINKSSYGDIALYYLKHNQTEKANEILKKYFANEKINIEILRIYGSYFDEKTYLARLMSENKPSRDTALKYLLSANDQKEALENIKDIISDQALLKDIELIFNQNKELYQYYKNMNSEVINGYYSLEKSYILLNTLKKGQVLESGKFAELDKYLSYGLKVKTKYH